MKIVFMLWLFTSNYAVEIAPFPDPMSCATAAVKLKEHFDDKPSAFMSKLVCVPVVVPGQEGPSI